MEVKMQIGLKEEDRQLLKSIVNTFKSIGDRLNNNLEKLNRNLEENNGKRKK